MTNHVILVIILILVAIHLAITLFGSFRGPRV
jgi:hypothetical protein